MNSILPPLFPWILTFGGLWMVVWLSTDTAQRFLYDEVVPRLPLRTTVLTLPLSYCVAMWPPEPTDLDKLVVFAAWQLPLWFVGIWLILRYQWPHALAAASLIFFIAVPILVIGTHSLGGGAATG